MASVSLLIQEVARGTTGRGHHIEKDPVSTCLQFSDEGGTSLAWGTSHWRVEAGRLFPSSYLKGPWPQSCSPEAWEGPGSNGIPTYGFRVSARQLQPLGSLVALGWSREQ